LKDPERPRGGAIRTSASSSGFRTGSERSRTAFNNWKIAVFAPMPSASVKTAINVKPGFFNSVRAP